MQLSFLDPGQLTARLELEAPLRVADGQGGAEIGTQPLAAVWARIEPVTRTLHEQASAASYTVTHRVWMRHRSDIAAGMRLRKGNRLFWIRALHDPDETQRLLVCYCEEEGR